MAIRHIGSIKNTGSDVIVVYRSLPDEADKCLVIFRDSIPEVYSHKILTFVNGVGQRSVDLFEVMHEAGLLEGQNMLTTLYKHGMLKKFSTSEVVMRPGGNQTIRLDELNNIIDDERKMSDGKVKAFNPFDMGSVEAKEAIEDRGLVQRLMKQHQEHVKQADSYLKRAMELDPSIKAQHSSEPKENVISIELPADISQSKAIELVKKAIKEFNEGKNDNT